MSKLSGGMHAGDRYTQLPCEFKERMKVQLGSSYEAFLASYNQSRTHGLRYNPLKIEKHRLVSLLQEHQIVLEPVSWAEEGFYYHSDAKPGRLALHEAGAYYIQEPSAMAAAELLEPQPGEKILDLCAAPGGKSTQIAGRMKGEGVLVSNEIIPSRAKILSQNLERMGISNALVLNETPQRLAQGFAGYFDRVIVDAPCSGEGMFRKDSAACGEWSMRQVEACAKRQREILACAVEMVRDGGVLVYSTCTFAPQENEENTAWLALQYPEFTLEKSMQIWPHLQRGEGHFAAKFSKSGAPKQAYSKQKSKAKAKKTGRLKEAYGMLLELFSGLLTKEAAALFEKQISMERLALFGECLYLIPDMIPDGITGLDGWKVACAGLQLGRMQKCRMEPAHALAMALWPGQVKQTLELEEPERYLRGEAACCSGLRGWTLATVHGCPLGWGKAVNGVLKNHYPKGLRK